jgi:ABC-type sugar transport system permease subunit
LVGPATVFVAAGLLLPLAILFRYSFDKVDARRIMIETFSFDNYVKFFSDPYYTGVLATDIAGGGALHRRSASSWVCRSPTCWRAPSRGTRTC